MRSARPITPGSDGGPVDDEQAFDFTEAELYGALRLEMPDDDARLQARRAADALRAGSAWATSDALLLLLSIGTGSGDEKVRRILRALREARYATWSLERREVDGGSPLSEKALRHRWSALTAEEDRDWRHRRDALRRSLDERGERDGDAA